MDKSSSKMSFNIHLEKIFDFDFFSHFLKIIVPSVGASALELRCSCIMR